MDSMRRLYDWLKICLVAGVAGVAVQAAEVEVRALGDGLWLHRSWRTVAPWGKVGSNGLIVREGDHVVVVDTAWGAEASRELLAWIDRELELPVERLIVTHFHSDRFGGWEVFAARGTRIVASARTLALADVAPTEAFDVFTLKPGERTTVGTLEVFYPGPAHTEDNVVVWLPEAKWLAGGCAVRSADSGGLGNVADANVAEWAASMRRIVQAYPNVDYVMPGHGEPGEDGLLRHTISLAEAAAGSENP